MAATGLNLNWTAVEFASSPITKVTSVSFNQGGHVITFSGDTNVFPIVGAVGANNPTASLTSGDVGTIETFEVGTSGTFTATLNDAKAATNGAVVFTSNVIISDVQSSGQHAQFASGTVSFVGISTDGTTNPTTIARS